MTTNDSQDASTETPAGQTVPAPTGPSDALLPAPGPSDAVSSASGPSDAMSSASGPSDAVSSASGPSDAVPEPNRRSRGDRRAVEDRRQREVPVEVERRAQPERRKAQRRKRRGPNQYELSADELEFIHAINVFKEQTGRPFPTWSEVLSLIRALGYVKQGD